MSESVGKRRLSRRQEKAIPILVAAASIAEGVRQAGICRDTFYAWYSNPDFKAVFEEERYRVISLALHELKTSASEAVNVLRELLRAEGEGVRLRTAQTILENVLKSIEIENLERRIDELEKRLKR